MPVKYKGILKIIFGIYTRCQQIDCFFPKIRTNYGIFNIRFQGAKIWNSITANIKFLPYHKFKNKIKVNFVESY